MKQRNQTAYEAAMTDKAYQKFRPKMFSCSGYSEKEFRRAAAFSISPLYWNESEVERAIRRDRMNKLDGSY